MSESSHAAARAIASARWCAPPSGWCDQGRAAQPRAAAAARGSRAAGRRRAGCATRCGRRRAQATWRGRGRTRRAPCRSSARTSCAARPAADCAAPTKTASGAAAGRSPCGARAPASPAAAATDVEVDRVHAQPLHQRFFNAFGPTFLISQGGGRLRVPAGHFLISVCVPRAKALFPLL